MPKYEAREFESHPLHVGDLEVQSYLELDDDADNDLYVQALRVRLEIHGWAFLRSRLLPMATKIMAFETSMRFS